MDVIGICKPSDFGKVWNTCLRIFRRRYSADAQHGSDNLPSELHMPHA